VSQARYVTGLRAVEQLLKTMPESIRRVFVEYRSKNPRVEAIVDELKSRGVDLQMANRARLAQMSGEERHQGVVAEIQRSTLLDEAGLRTLVEASLENDEQLLLLVLDGIEDPHNLGACLRTADATGVHAVVVPKHRSAGLGPAVSKVAAGAAETVPFAAVTNLNRVLDWLGDYGVFRIATSDQASAELYAVDLTGPLALVMGKEGPGVSPSLIKRCDALVSIPMAGAVSSLNVSVATAVCLYETVRQRRNPG
jgi:23S rRNA (guanosine2251-2'-O)-methyltransferase